MTKPYRDIFRKHLSRQKGGKNWFWLTTNTILLYFFPFKVNELRANNPILINTSKFNVQFFKFLPLALSPILLHFWLLQYADNTSPLSSVVSMFLLCFLINLFFSCK